MKTSFSSLIAVLLLVSCSSAVNAQMFGERTLGRSLSRGSPARSGAAPGTADGDRRFLRGQREAGEIVGAPGAAGFVGGMSAVDTVTSSVSDLREQVRPSLNRPRIVRNTGLYAERLQMNEDDRARSGQLLTAAGTSAALRSLIQRQSLAIEVSQEGRVATLRGEVASERDRQLTEAFVLFEPGIQTVVNELRVNPLLPAMSTPANRRVSKDRSSNQH